MGGAIRKLFGARPTQPAPVHMGGLEAFLQGLTSDVKAREERLAREEAEMREERQRRQAEVDRLKTELREERGNMQEMMTQLQEAQKNVQDQQRFMHQKQQEMTAEKAELDRKIAMEAALREKRYELRTQDDLERMRREAQEEIGFDRFEFNVGMVGQTGTGKSTLINALCGLADDDPGAARTGETETTMEMTKYKHPHAQNLAVWDLPGAGTATHPIATFFYDKYLFMFDALVIMYEVRFKEADADLIRQAMAFRVPFAVVRTKADDALRSRKRMTQNAGKTDEVMVSELIDLFRKNTADELAKFNTHIDQHSIFVINSRALTDANEPHFQETELIQYVCTAARNHRP